MIEVRDLVFEYPSMRALDGVGFDVDAGSVTALVGPNGAGKTTLLCCVAALRVPFRGSIRLAGVDVLESPRECHRRIGFLADFYGLYEQLTVRRCLQHAARRHGVAPTDVDQRLARAVQRLRLEPHLEQRAGALSRGERQRLAIAQAIVHEPEVLLLDEPASGLDPEARHELSGLIVALRDAGMTLVVSSHILAELEEYCTGMLILNEGRLIDARPSATPDAGRLLNLEFLGDPAPVRAALEARVDVGDVRLDAASATFRYRGDREAQTKLIADLVRAGIAVAALGEAREGLQAAYLRSVGEGGRA
jgi:ABC-2 type transport system ATP-binding protein